jgi:hypothetical protein
VGAEARSTKVPEEPKLSPAPGFNVELVLTLSQKLTGRTDALRIHHCHLV